MTKLNRLVRNDKVVTEIEKAVFAALEDEVVTYTVDVESDTENNYTDVNATIFINGEMLQEISVATADAATDELETKAFAMKKKLVEYVTKKTDVEYGTGETEEAERTMGDFELMNPEAKVVTDTTFELPAEVKAELGIEETEEKEETVEEEAGKERAVEYDVLDVAIIQNAKNKSDAIRKLYDRKHTVLEIFHILNLEGIKTRYQMVYQVIERYEDKLEMERMNEEA